MNQYLCPKCSVAMVNESRGTARCSQCDGRWLPGCILAEAVGGDTHPLRALQTRDHPTSLACPSCSEHQLFELRFESHVLDACAACRGVLFDPGELDAVRARLKDTARQLMHTSHAKNSATYGLLSLLELLRF